MQIFEDANICQKKTNVFWSWLQKSFLRWCWKQLRLSRKISAYENQCQGKPFRFLGSFVSFSSYIPTDMPYIFLVTNSQFTLALCHLLQTNSYHSPWEKVVITASTLTFCVHVIVTSSLALKCWIIPAVFLHSKVLEKALLRMMVVMMMI